MSTKPGAYARVPSDVEGHPSALENATAQFHLMASENSAVVAIDSINFGGVDY
jgi:hypothetical protein